MRRLATGLPAWWRLVLGCALLCPLGTGCGGSPAPAPPIARRAAPPADAEPADASPAQAPAQPAAESSPAAPAAVPSVVAGTGERFEVVDVQAVAPRFAIDGAEGTTVDTFTYTPLGQKADASTFALATVPPAPAPANARPTVPAKPLPEGFSLIPGAGVSPEGLPLRVLCNRDESVMVLIPAGTFLQGNSEGPANCRPEHGVYLDACYIDAHEVTVGQYEKFRSEWREAKKRIAQPLANSKERDEPALGLSFNDALQYARFYGKELPTEAQWEKAARGTEGFDHPWGNGPHLWHRPRMPQQIDPVASFPQDLSPFGIYDLAGNAREWCTDWYSDSTYTQRLATSEAVVRNPTGPKASGGQYQRVVKGGDPQWRVWTRTGVEQTERRPDIGFRCVITVRMEPGSTSPDENN